MHWACGCIWALRLEDQAADYRLSEGLWSLVESWFSETFSCARSRLVISARSGGKGLRYGA